VRFREVALDTGALPHLEHADQPGDSARHQVEEPGFEGKWLFSGCARAFLRNNEDQYPCGAQATGKWEKIEGIRGKKGFPARFKTFLRGQVGGKIVLEQTMRNCIGKQPPKKGLFFHSIAGF
jgi:hypothetical protein